MAELVESLEASDTPADVPEIEDMAPIDAGASEPDVGVDKGDGEESTQAAETSEAPIEEAVAPEEDDSGSLWMRNAQRAMAEGQSAKAQRFLLEAALQISREQEDGAQANVQKTEERVQETSRTIDEARSEVATGETCVAEAEKQVADGREELRESREQSESHRESLLEVGNRLADLDGQIRRLQEKRDETETARAAAEEALHEALDQDKAKETSADALREEEQKARVQLEDWRQNVQSLEAKRTTFETELVVTREALERQRASSADIEKTIEQSGVPELSDASDEADLLF